jgi:membrane protease YdiL (CAAX protease family)
MSSTVAVGAYAIVSGRGRRLIEVALFVGAWMAIGLALQLNGSVYLLLGLPLTVAFQVLVRRRAVRELWVRSGPAFRLDAWTVVIGSVLLALAYPAYLKLSSSAVEPVLIALWMAAFLVGVVGATYALRNLQVDSRALLIAALAVAIGVLDQMLTGGLDLLLAGRALPFDRMLGAALLEASLALPIAFAIEEVTFRGLLDAHASQPGESRVWVSALVVSALWGLWHLPINVGSTPLAILIPLVLISHCAVGIPLSFAWRRSGTLAVPAAAHAIIDSVRDGLLAAM